MPMPAWMTRARGRRLAAWVAVLVLSSPATACLKPYCEADTDCAEGQRCNLDRHRCEGNVLEDAGHSDAGDAGDAGLPDAAGDASPGCTTGTCENPTPICDATGLDCRGCTGDPECQSLETDRPWCDEGSCVGCFDALLHCADPTPICDATTLECAACWRDQECADLEAGRPWCDGGACVECTESTHCTTTGSAVCEPTSHGCRPCESHAECEHLGGVCDAGTCLTESQVLYVRPGTSCGSATGTRSNPFCEISAALSATWTGRRVVLVEDGTYAPITIRNDNVWILGAGNAAVVQATSAEAVWVTISVSGEVTTARLEGLTIRGAQGAYSGLHCNTSVSGQSPTLILHGCTVTANAANGVHVTGCDATLTANHIHANSKGLTLEAPALLLDGNLIESNPGGGITLGPSTGHITNNLIARNGTTTSAAGGIYVSGTGGTVEILHNTIAGNQTDMAGKEPGVSCYNTSCPGIALSSNLFTNPVSPPKSDVSLAFTPTYSFIGTGDLGVGLGNINGDPGVVDTVEYRLASNSPCRGAASPGLNVITDRDGESRPQPAGSTPDIGADEVP